MPLSKPFFLAFILLVSAASSANEQDRRAAYVEAVVRGAGLMDWQETGPTAEEIAFREKIERRKDHLLRHRTAVQRPAMFSEEALARVARKIEGVEPIGAWFENNLQLADWIIEQGPGYVESMIPELTPTNSYGLTCPNCVGVHSQEGTGTSLMTWSHKHPDRLTCRACGQVYPDEKYPETLVIQAPRSGQSFSYFLNDRQKADPDNRTGELAYHWVGYPVYISFTGTIRERKISFMMSSLTPLAFAYRFTGEAKYAEKAKEIFLRLAECYPKWLYHDYWGTIADCDPMYAAWHDKSLPIEWKRHHSTNAFRKDRLDKAAMLQTYWGCGRIHPSTDGISGLDQVCIAYDFIAEATREDGAPVWSDEEKLRVERDFIIEYVIGAEPFVGGEGRADEHNNKTPRVYHAQASVAKCFNIPELADVAIRGYENVRDNSFLDDGLSSESPSYTNMYLAELIAIPETLDGFRWPQDFNAHTGVYEPYANDRRLRMMYRAVIDQLRSDYSYLPLSDTHEGSGPSRHIVEYGLKRYPEYYEGKFPALTGGTAADQFALFHLEMEELQRDEPFELPEIYFPQWMTSIFRHGEGRSASVLSLAFNPRGGHRHADNLSLYYYANGSGALGDLGYVGDMPVNDWIRSTKSHNLVVVDDSEQLFWGDPTRIPKLNLLFNTPEISVVEAESKAYSQCSEYRRMVALFKGPNGRSFAVDVFRVKGGNRHDYRLYSEIASSHALEGELAFVGIEFPKESPLPVVGSSLERADIFGLQNKRTVTPPQTDWQAIWRERGREFRFWNLSEAAEVSAANGPGQRGKDESGRRVRYLDVSRIGEDLQSLFVGVHDPADASGEFSVRGVERLSVPAEAGGDAAAIRIETGWGVYEVFSDFSNPADIEGTTFHGKFGVQFQPTEGKGWILGASAETLVVDSKGFGFKDELPSVRMNLGAADPEGWPLKTPLPEGFSAGFEGAVNHILVHDGSYQTGFPVDEVLENRIDSSRFPLPPAQSGVLPNLIFQVSQPDS